MQDFYVSEIKMNHDTWLFWTDISILQKTNEGLHKRQTSVGRELLIYGIKRVYGIVITEEDILISGTGKPYIQISKRKKCIGKDKKYAGGYFNISHSGKYVVCAVSDIEIGCDIQKIRSIPRNLYPRLKKFADMNGFVLDSACHRLSVFNQTLLWTRYESLGKYLGTGIPVPETIFFGKKDRQSELKEGFISTTDSQLKQIYRVEKQIGKWQFFSYFHRTEYVLTICFRRYK